MLVPNSQRVANDLNDGIETNYSKMILSLFHHSRTSSILVFQKQLLVLMCVFLLESIMQGLLFTDFGLIEPCLC